jgi:hypothetical protein
MEQYLSYGNVKDTIDKLQLTNTIYIRAVLVKNNRPWYNPLNWFYFILKKVLHTNWNHSVIFIEKNNIPILVAQAIGKGVVFQKYEEWFVEEKRDLKFLDAYPIIFEVKSRILNSYYFKYDYVKYIKHMCSWFIPVTEIVKPPVYCHELFPYYLHYKNGPWHPNRLITTFSKHI